MQSLNYPYYVKVVLFDNHCWLLYHSVVEFPDLMGQKVINFL